MNLENIKQIVKYLNGVKYSDLFGAIMVFEKLDYLHDLEDLNQQDLDYLEDYERKYETFEIIVSSNRIDTVISTICHTARNNISNMIKSLIIFSICWIKEFR